MRPGYLRREQRSVGDHYTCHLDGQGTWTHMRAGQVTPKRNEALCSQRDTAKDLRPFATIGFPVGCRRSAIINRKCLIGSLRAGALRYRRSPSSGSQQTVLALRSCPYQIRTGWPNESSTTSSPFHREAWLLQRGGCHEKDRHRCGSSAAGLGTLDHGSPCYEGGRIYRPRTMVR